MRRYRDSEGIVHFTGPGLAVNSGLCGNNDNTGEDDDCPEPCECPACIAIVAYVKSNGRKG